MSLRSRKVTGDEPRLIDPSELTRRLLSHPDVTAQLLQEFWLDPSLADLDLSSIEPVKVDLNMGTHRSFHSVSVWRVARHDGGDLYLLLLLAVVPTSDRYIALRVFDFAGQLLCWEIKQKRRTAYVKMPSILPIVLYTGEERWTAPLELGQLIGPSSLSNKQAEQRYYLVDARRQTDQELQARAGLPAIWFRLLASADREQMAAESEAAQVWFASHPGFFAAEPIFADILAMKSAMFEAALHIDSS